MTPASRRLLMAAALLGIWSIPVFLTEWTIAASNFAGGVTIRISPVGNRFGEWLIWAPLTLVVAWLVRRFPFERQRLRTSLTVHAIAAIAAGVVTAAWFVAMVRLSDSPQRVPPNFFLATRVFLGTRIPLGFVIYVAIAGVVVAFDERKRREERELRAAQLQAALAQAQLRALQMRLQPHFLFNTLHVIGMLVRDNPAEAGRVVSHLGDLLRQTLTLADVAEVPLRDEIAVLRRYLDIERARFSDRLTATIDVPDDVLDDPVPTFILQPVVENAVRHGIAPRDEAGHVSVRARRHGDSLVLVVEDDGPGFTGQSRDGSGIGLATTRERLAMLYDGTARMTCATGASGGARVTIELPIAHA